MKEIGLALADSSLLWTAAALFWLLFVLAAVWQDLAHHTVRIYNWDGEKYRLLGRERLRRRNGAYVVAMRERKGDLSYTTRYLLYASAGFVKRHRYENLLFRAGANEAWLPVEERMQAEILFSYR